MVIRDLVGHPIKGLEDSSAESHNDYGGPAQEAYQY